LEVGVIEMNKESYIEIEKWHLFNLMEFSRMGFTDYHDRKECDIHRISYCPEFVYQPQMLSKLNRVYPFSNQTNDCPLCVLRKTFLCTPEEIQLTKDEYATKLKENGYTQDHIKNIIDYVFGEESK